MHCLYIRFRSWVRCLVHRRDLRIQQNSCRVESGLCAQKPRGTATMTGIAFRLDWRNCQTDMMLLCDLVQFSKRSRTAAEATYCLHAAHNLVTGVKAQGYAEYMPCFTFSHWGTDRLLYIRPMNIWPGDLSLRSTMTF